MRSIGVKERRARLGRRHRLAPGHRAADPAEAAEAMAGLHGTDATSIFLAIRARADAVEIGTITDALYEERSLLRILSMRRTMFASSPAQAAVMFGACSKDVAARERRRLLKLLDEAGIGDEAWLERAEQATIAALAALGEATVPELAAHDPLLATELVMSPGKKYEAKQKIVSRILLILSASGEAVRTRPRGTWTSTQFEWAALERWHPGLEIPGPEQARAELACLWLRRFGPGTPEDLRWWTGWTVGATRAALASLQIEEVDLDGVQGLVLADDIEPEPEPEPWIALLPALDSTPMGWKQRDWYLGAHGELLFDRNGNAGPMVWADGRAVGGWTQAPDGEIRVKLLEDVGSEATAAIEEEAERVGSWVEGARISPRARGRTPIEQELLA